MTPFRFALLGLLRSGPASGYDLRRVFASTPLGSFSDSPGAVYPALRALEQQGLVEGAEATSGKRTRVLYQITREGELLLERWIREPVDAETAAREPDLYLLKFAFAEQVLSQDEARDFLATFERAQREQGEALEAHLASMTEQPLFARLALQHGIEVCRASARWAGLAAAQISRTEEP